VHFPKRLLPNGETEDFAIPHGKTLVITDVEWNWSNQNQPFVNQNQLFRLFLGPNTANDVAKSVAMTNSNSFAGAMEALTSGFTVAQGTPVCGFFAFGPSQFLAPSTSLVISTTLIVKSTITIDTVGSSDLCLTYFGIRGLRVSRQARLIC
jgi:hypothetical protein